MGVNTVTLESYVANTAYNKTVAKEQMNDFKALINSQAKKQSDKKAETKTDKETESSEFAKKTDTKTDTEVKTNNGENDVDGKNEEVFENEKNNYMEQAFLARNAVEVVNIEVEEVQDVVLTAATEVSLNTPQVAEAVLTAVGEEMVEQSTTESLVDKVMDNTSIIKTPTTNEEAKTDVTKDEKATFKLVDTASSVAVPQEKVAKTDVSTANAQSEIKAGDEAVAPKVVSEAIGEGENSVEKKDNLEIKGEAQTIAMQGKDVIVIKVADPVTQATGDELAQKLGNEIVVKLDSGTNEFKAVLNPEGLGEIEVKLSVESGKVAISMTCSNEATKALLENNVSSLIKIVESSMGQEAVVNIYNEKNSGQENFDGQGNKGQYQGDSNNNQRDNDEVETDFIQKLRLGILEMGTEGV